MIISSCEEGMYFNESKKAVTVLFPVLIMTLITIISFSNMLYFNGIDFNGIFILSLILLFLFTFFYYKELYVL